MTIYEQTRTDRSTVLAPGIPKHSDRATMATLVRECGRWLGIRRGRRSAPGRRLEITAQHFGTLPPKLGETAAILPGTGHRRLGRRSIVSNSPPKCGKSHIRRRKLTRGGGCLSHCCRDRLCARAYGTTKSICWVRPDHVPTLEAVVVARERQSSHWSHCLATGRCHASHVWLGAGLLWRASGAPGDWRRAVHQPQDGHHPREQHPQQNRRSQPSRGSNICRSAGVSLGSDPKVQRVTLSANSDGH